MKLNQAGIDLIKSFEGCRLTAYRDAVGVLTIGYGHTANVYAGEVISQEAADHLLATDCASFAVHVVSLIKPTISDNQFSALVSFAYNLGVGALAHSTLLRYVNEGLFNEASNQFIVWDNAGGHVLPGLARRRLAEKALFLA